MRRQRSTKELKDRWSARCFYNYHNHHKLVICRTQIVNDNWNDISVNKIIKLFDIANGSVTVEFWFMQIASEMIYKMTFLLGFGYVVPGSTSLQKIMLPFLFALPRCIIWETIPNCYNLLLVFSRDSVIAKTNIADLLACHPLILNESRLEN